MEREFSSPTCFLDFDTDHPHHHQQNLSPSRSQPHPQPTATMSAEIPTAGRVVESAVISAQLSKVWHLIKLQDFATFWTKLSKSEIVKGVSPDTDVVKWTFQDGSEFEVKLEEHSVRGMLRLL